MISIFLFLFRCQFPPIQPIYQIFLQDGTCNGATHQEMTGSGWRDVEITAYSGRTTLEKDNFCCSKCNQRVDCEYWVRATDSNYCWLKSNNGNAIQEVTSNTRRGGLRSEFT